MSASNALLETLLSKIDLFEGLEASQIRLIASQCRFKRYPKGQILFDEGDEGHELIVIKSGHIEIARHVSGGDFIQIAVRGPGEAIGEMALFDGKPRSATATALEEIEIGILRAADFAHCVRQAPVIALNALRCMSMRLREASSLTVRTQAQGVDGRLADELLSLFDSVGETVDGVAVLRLPYTQTTLAKRIGAKRETVNRALGALRDRGVVKPIDKATYALDLKRLRRIAQP